MARNSQKTMVGVILSFVNSHLLNTILAYPIKAIRSFNQRSVNPIIYPKLDYKVLIN